MSPRRRTWIAEGGAFLQTLLVLGSAVGTYGYVTNFVNNNTTFLRDHGRVWGAVILGGALLRSSWRMWLADYWSRFSRLIKGLTALRNAAKRDKAVGAKAMEFAKADWLIEQVPGFLEVLEYDPNTGQVVLDSGNIRYRPDRDLRGVQFTIQGEDRDGEKATGRLIRCNAIELILQLDVPDKYAPAEGDLATPVRPKASDLEKALGYILISSDF